MQPISQARAAAILAACSGKCIAVVGDLMLDRYFWGNVSRISPEAPVPVIDLEHESLHLGGAANVAGNLASLGIKPLLCGVAGQDNSGRALLEIMQQAGSSTAGILTVENRPTTVKTRIIGNNQQIARLDREVRSPITPQEEHALLDRLQKAGDLAGIILEDYNKGVMTHGLITRICAFAAQAEIPVFVDPKFSNFFSYKGVTLFKPNRKEAAEALGFALRTEQEIEKAGRELLERLECQSVLLTLGEKGMMLFQADGSIASVPTRARKVADVSGAGDTAIATLAAAIAGKATMPEAAQMANYAAGVVCEQPGIVSVNPAELCAAIALHE
jgi:D-beta-D-heptose 7-phosphate kinase/D-beta-D-heptose 1-phosphate adenosyltransferase